MVDSAYTVLVSFASYPCFRFIKKVDIIRGADACLIVFLLIEFFLTLLIEAASFLNTSPDAIYIACVAVTCPMRAIGRAVGPIHTADQSSRYSWKVLLCYQSGSSAESLDKCDDDSFYTVNYGNES